MVEGDAEAVHERNEKSIEREPMETKALQIVDRSTSVEAMSVSEIVAQVTLIQNVMRAVMKEGEHFGAVPGCGDKKTLLQPGAQKLTMTFRLAPEYTIQETDLGRGHKEYRVVATLKSIQTGNFVGEGVGVCSTMESKYRYRGGARKCPNCGKETIIKGKAEYGGGWLCFAKKGGCGAKWPDGAQVIEGQNIERIEHDNPADHYNTVLKMAKKRSFVDATITATAASDIFTQDIGDDEDNGNGAESMKGEGRIMKADDEGGFDSAAPNQTIPQKHAQVFGEPSSINLPPSTLPPKTPPAASQPAGAPETPAERKERLLRLFRPFGTAAEEKFVEHGLVLAGEKIDAIDDVKVANISKIHVETLLAEVKVLYGGKASPVPSEGDARLPDDLHNPADYTVHPPTDEPWRNLLTPFSYKDSPPAGTRLGDLDKKYLFFWVMVFAPKQWQDKEKRWHEPNKKSVEFFNALKQYRKAIAHRYNFTEPEITP